MTDESTDERGMETAEEAAAIEAIAESLAEETPDAERAASEADCPAAAESDAADPAASVVTPAPEVTVPALPVSEPPAALPAAPSRRNLVSPWPFVAYVALWAVFAGIVAWRLAILPASQPVLDSAEYPLTVLAGLVLAFAGPLLVIAVWASTPRDPGVTRWAVFVDSLLRGSVAMAVGVTLWWAVLVLVDQVRLGRIL